MKSAHYWSLFIVAIALLFGTAATHGQIISSNNPYRSFNISGINYGSQQWERNHRKQQLSGQQPSTRQSSRTPRRSRVRIRSR